MTLPARTFNEFLDNLESEAAESERQRAVAERIAALREKVEEEGRRREEEARRVTFTRQCAALERALKKQGGRLVTRPVAVEAEWRLVPEAHEYEVSEHGVIRKAGALWALKCSVSDSGYVYYTLKGRSVLAHRAVALAFLPNPNDLPQVNHIDLDRSHNHVSNLEWVSSLTNLNHTKRLAIEAFARSAAIVRAHAVEYPDNPRVIQALNRCVDSIETLSRSVDESIDADHFELAMRRLRQRGHLND